MVHHIYLHLNQKIRRVGAATLVKANCTLPIHYHYYTVLIPAFYAVVRPVLQNSLARLRPPYPSTTEDLQQWRSIAANATL